MMAMDAILLPPTPISPSMKVLLECIGNLKDSHEHDKIAEILKGAHIVLYDGGSLYNVIKSKEGAKIRRISSHYVWDKNPQYSLSYPPHFPEVLIGVINKDNSQIATWFQMERHRVDYSPQSIKHFFDFMRYLYEGKNIGPLGDSVYTHFT